MRSIATTMWEDATANDANVWTFNPDLSRPVYCDSCFRERRRA